MLKVANISKTYPGGLKALENITLNIPKGIFGLLGPNGAGKSSLMRTLATLQTADTGTIELNDLDILENPLEARRHIGYLPQDMGVYPRVTAFEMLDYLSGLKGIPSKSRKNLVNEYLERVNLLDVAHRRLDTYSGGMKRRFGIASAFIGSPSLVIVDEPTAGLDPSERRRFQFLLSNAAQDCVLILSSHIVEDLAGLCTDMALMHSGEIVLSGSPAKLVKELEYKVWEKTINTEELAQLQNDLHVLSWRPHQGELRIRVFSDTQPMDFTLANADLEDLYSLKIGGQ